MYFEINILLHMQDSHIESKDPIFYNLTYIKQPIFINRDNLMYLYMSLYLTQLWDF